MVTPSTTTAARRRRLAGTSEPSADTNPATIIEPIGEADVIEQIGGKTVAYKAKVTQDETPETNDQTEIDDLESDFEDYQEAPANIPKNPLAIMFDDLREVSEVGEVFIADIVRNKDFMNDGFNTPCNDQMALPPLQLTAGDYFTILANIQKHNNNSGGRFTIRICRQDGEPVEKYYRARSIHAGDHGMLSRPVGVANLLVANPTREAIALAQENPNAGNTGLAMILQQMQKEQREFNQNLLNNMRPQEDVLMQAVKQKMVNDIINPPERKSNGFDINEFTEKIMMQGAVVTGMGEAFNKMMYREPPAPPEPTFIDQMNQVLGNPVVGGLIERASNVIEAVAVAKAENAGTPITVDMEEDIDEEEEAAPVMQTAPVIEVEQQSNAENMKELLLTATEELEGKNPLDNTNVALQALAADYPTEFDNLKLACTNMPYEVILNMLLPRLATFEGFDYAAYINEEETKKQNAYIWQPKKGEKMNKRLRELYEYLKTLP